MTSKQTQRKRIFKSGLAMLLLGATLGLTGFVSAPAGAADVGEVCLSDLNSFFTESGGSDGEAIEAFTAFATCLDADFGVACTDGLADVLFEAWLIGETETFDGAITAAVQACMESSPEATTTTTEPEATTTTEPEATTTTTVLGSSELPRTGSGSTLPFSQAAIVLLGIGVALLAAARMRIEQS